MKVHHERTSTLVLDDKLWEREDLQRAAIREDIKDLQWYANAAKAVGRLRIQGINERSEIRGIQRPANYEDYRRV